MEKRNLRPVRRLTLTRVGIGSLARWGCFSGALTALLPGLCLAWVGWSLLRALRTSVEGWKNLRVDLPLGQTLPLNLVDLLRLQPVVDTLRAIEGLGVAGMLLLTFSLAVLLGLFVMLNVVLLGLLFNSATWLAGGIEVEALPSQPPNRV